MQRTVQHDGIQVTVALSGSLDVDSAYDVYIAVTGEAEQGFHQVVLDLSAVDFIDSIGLGMLVRCRDDLTDRYEATLTLRAPSRRVLKLLDITALTPEFVIEH